VCLQNTLTAHTPGPPSLENISSDDDGGRAAPWQSCHISHARWSEDTMSPIEGTNPALAGEPVSERFQLTLHPFKTDYLPLSYSGNPGVNDESYGGVNWKRLGQYLFTLTSRDRHENQQNNPVYATTDSYEVEMVSLNSTGAVFLYTIEAQGDGVFLVTIVASTIGE
jgi:hypothetical protein